MGNCIAILPDSVANQIAAGEVIQQPASVVKELMENAFDAGATSIEVNIKDAGKTLIQISDNGRGMSAEDARLCFERHATSKLRQSQDLFAIRTMGFRGEALASIAAIAQVELTTRQAEDEVGSRVVMAGSVLESQEPVAAEKGTCFSVRNIFYNVPARRKFLGSNAKQFSAIRSEFIQQALAHPDIRLSLRHNGEMLYQLPAANLRQRIIALLGDQLNKKLYPVEVETEFVKISGFVGDPSAARKRAYEQYFFVNKRYIRHPYFRKAVMEVYEPLTAPGMQPVYFLFFDVPTDSIDVNISPTKTEVKFENEQIIWPILNASVRECLGKFNAVPSLDFDQEDAPQIDVFSGSRDVPQPRLDFDPNYNPFHKKAVDTGWEKLYRGQESEQTEHYYRQPEPHLPQSREDVSQGLEAFRADAFDEIPRRFEEAEALQTIFSDEEMSADSDWQPCQLFGRYLLIPCGDAVLLIDQHRAQIRIWFERYSKQLESHQAVSQTLLFPEELELGPHQMDLFRQIQPLLSDLGFRFEQNGQRWLITGIPEQTQGLTPTAMIQDLTDAAQEDIPNFSKELKDRLALKMAQVTSIPYGLVLNRTEMKTLCRQLFDCAIQNYTPDGRRIIVRLSCEELIKRF